LTRRTFLLIPIALRAAGLKLNIVVVIARGWRGLSTPWSGDPDLRAPFLSSFAQDALVFPRAYAAYPRWQQAQVAISYGRYPHVAPGAKDPTLASTLEAAGYKSGKGTPYFLSAVLEPGDAGNGPDPADLHLRENVPEDDAERARTELSRRYAGYAAMDRQFAKLMEGVDAANTIVVFTSDAGELIGSHGMDGDDSFYEESVRVPLAVRIPGVKGSASDLLVSHVDLMPTLLALSGVSGADSVEDVQGLDLSASWMGKQGARREAVLAEGRIGEPDEWRMLVQGYDKIVTNATGDPTHLFNLAEDPYELKNLVRDPKVQLKRAQLAATIRAERSRVLDFRRR
jgi:arylsulfatase A-like enzyme